MLKVLFLMLSSSVFLLASGGGHTEIAPDLTGTWVGIASLVIFVIGYYFVAAEEKYHIDKAKPALFIGIFMLMLIAAYYAMNDLNMDLVHTRAKH